VIDGVGEVGVAFDQREHLVELAVVDQELADRVGFAGGRPERLGLEGV